MMDYHLMARNETITGVSTTERLQGRMSVPTLFVKCVCPSITKFMFVLKSQPLLYDTRSLSRFN